jgi:ankyrin repeat protein
MPSSIRKVLDELPTTLDDTYERALQGIPKQKLQHAFHLFQCLTAAIRPLRVEELAEMFAINFDADLGPNLMEGWRPENPEEAVLSTCSTLIAVIEDENGTRIVQFSHFSVKEFLTSDRVRTSDVGYIRFYHIPLDDAHTVLARACLTVLLQLDANVDQKRLAAFPLAFYAAQHWVDHAKFEDVALRIQDSMEHLFDPRSPYLAAWVWIHNVEDWYHRSIEEHPSRPEATALYYAALCGFSRLANYLISTHAEDVNAMCSRHGTPLHAASYEGHINVVRLLLHHGAEVNLENKAMRTPLCSAFEGGHVEVVRLLLERGADANVQIPTTFSPPILVQASANGRIDIVHMLLQRNVNVNDLRDDLHWTALHNASFNGHLKVVKLLLEHGAEVNALVVQILLEHGADVHLRAFDNLTAFQLATSSGHTEVAQLLLKHGAKLE